MPTIPTLHGDRSTPHDRDPLHLQIGEIYRDFLVRREIGRGAFGVVYFAEQVSLRRTVALKVTDLTRDDGSIREGQTLAQLEHPSIVRVYAQVVDEANHRRLLCMQYVPGLNLRSLMRRVRESCGDDWSGADLLKVLEEVSEEGAMANETSIADREHLASLDKFDCVCWFGMQMAAALLHAHEAGFVHQDVKPENTIVDRFGRPMLVDFNLATEAKVEHYVGGGTVPYMSPESITAFVSGEINQSSRISSDIYSLGILLWELAASKLPFDHDGVDSLKDPQQFDLLLTRRSEPPAGRNRMPAVLANALRPAFSSDAGDRYSSARDFGDALKGVMRRSRVDRMRHGHSRLGDAVMRQPLIWFVIAALIPHCVTSALQIAYNQAEIIGDLQLAESRELFEWLLLVVNPIAYGVCVGVVIWWMIKAFRPWKQLSALHAGQDHDDLEQNDVLRQDADRRDESLSPTVVADYRKTLLRLPLLTAVVGCMGWLSSAVVFPSVIYFWGEQFGLEVWLHFICSFAMSGSITAIYCYGLTMSLVVFAMYPSYFAEPQEFLRVAGRETEPIGRIWTRLPLLAGLIPMTTAVLVVATFRPESLTSFREQIAFKGLVIGLLLLSSFGFLFVRRIGRVVLSLIQEFSQPE